MQAESCFPEKTKTIAKTISKLKKLLFISIYFIVRKFQFLKEYKSTRIVENPTDKVINECVISIKLKSISGKETGFFVSLLLNTFGSDKRLIFKI